MNITRITGRTHL